MGFVLLNAGCAVEVLMLIGLVVINGLFAMSEIALVTARKARLMKLAADGDRAAAVALKLGEDPTKFLSTIQIGITSIGLLNGVVGEAVLAEPLARLLSLGLPEASAHLAATAVVVVAVTYVSIVVGELAPKRLGQINPELIARLAARPMQLLAMHPAVCHAADFLHPHPAAPARRAPAPERRHRRRNSRHAGRRLRKPG